MKKRILGLMLVLVLVALMATAIPASAVPLMDHLFRGHVVNGVPGDIISVQIRGVEYATTTIDLEGNYGYDPFLKVPSDDYGTRRIREGGRNGDKVEFYIKDQLVGIATFKFWELTTLDLVYEEPEDVEPEFVNLRVIFSIPPGDIPDFLEAIPYEVLESEIE